MYNVRRLNTKLTFIFNERNTPVACIIEDEMMMMKIRMMMLMLL